MGNGALDKKYILKKVREYSMVLILVVFLVVMQILQPKFLSPANICSILYSVSGSGIVAIGAMFVLITGGMDFTAGYGVALCGVVGGFLYSKSGSAIVMIVGCMITGMLIGLTNGLIVTKMHIKSFIATLAMMFTIQGLIYIICEGNIVFLDDPLSKWLGKGTIGGVIPMQALILVGMTALAHLLLTRTRMGTYTYAIGGNEEAGRYAGVDIDKYKILVFSFAGICTGVASCMMVTQVSMISPTIGSTTLMDAIAAAVIGGTSTLGGKGSAFGTLIGALIIGVISNALILLYVPTNAQYLVKGMIIISALYLNQLMNVGEK